jgi:hypothetical protein
VLFFNKFFFVEAKKQVVKMYKADVGKADGGHFFYFSYCSAASFVLEVSTLPPILNRTQASLSMKIAAQNFAGNCLLGFRSDKPPQCEIESKWIHWCAN